MGRLSAYASRLTAVLMVAALAACSPGSIPGSSGSPSPSSSTQTSAAPTTTPRPPASGTASATEPSPPTTPSAPTATATPSRTPTTSSSPTAKPTSTPTAATTPPPSPTSTLPASLRGRILTVLPTTQKVVALTFDGGASDAGAPSILATLAQSGVRATFFPTGAFARMYPARVQSFAASGHRVANHSDTHPDFTTLTAAEQASQLARAEAAIRPLTERTTRPWFRFPYGSSSPAAIETVNAEGYSCIGWTVDTLGWKGTSGGQTVETVVARVLSTVRPGQIVLMHVGANPTDGSTLDADALPTLIAELRALGYGFVTIDVALA